MSSSGPGGLWSLLSFPSVECIEKPIVTKHKGAKRRYYNALGEQMDNIELNVANARVYIGGGTNRLISANAMKKKGGYLVYWIWAVVAILLLICIIKTAT
ncbi:hypothetical protein IFM89_028150 [Coptis chinensis]|uniref:t-SNARE coiled-coil homology domain-containing protein n=1 Tax=Coptis chinensis TaxID=261450 RepID=A0A835LXH0_9MAGN|nr:hypothetical protein IFM89_028150 [Coptis chinensis]